MFDFARELANKARFLATYCDKKEPICGAGHANIAEHTRSLDLQERLFLILHVSTYLTRKFPFVEAHQKNNRELQPFGRMDSLDILPTAQAGGFPPSRAGFPVSTKLA